MAPLPYPDTNDITPIPTTDSSLDGLPLAKSPAYGSAVLISDAETVSEIEVRRRKRRGSRSSRGTPVVERIVVQERTERRMG
ncbi:hypothetical protein VE04_10005, partial [Pseudogymnoascus sp. 24MN13]